MHAPTFFAFARRAPFGGRLSQSQVDGLNNIILAWAMYGDGDARKLAYIFATVFHETGGLFQPVRESFAKTDAEARKNLRNRKYAKPAPNGHAYYGRGYVQLTWEENYATMTKLSDGRFDLMNNPDLAMKPDVSAWILIEGMMRGASSRGDFTGKALEDYFNDEVTDPVGARRIVNGTDKDELIAGYYEAFMGAIRGAEEAADGLRKPEGISAPIDPTEEPRTQMDVGAVLTAVGGLVAAVPPLIQEIDSPYALIALLMIAGGAGWLTFGRRKLQREIVK